MTVKSQPWKASWPPREQTSNPTRIYMTDTTGAALVDGCGAPVELGGVGFFGLCCQKEQAKSRAQPWKANWSPEKHAVDGGHPQYLSDENGAALVDGLAPPDDGWIFDLYC